MAFEGFIGTGRTRYEKPFLRDALSKETLVIPQETITPVQAVYGRCLPGFSNQPLKIQPSLPIPPPRESRASRIATRFFTPLMKLLSWAFKERAQETHPWNVQKYISSDLNSELLAHVSGTNSGWVNALPSFIPSWVSKVLSHAPIVGGWREYVVLEASTGGEEWHIGWESSQGTTEISTIPLTEARVRMLTGPVGNTTRFFAVNANGIQLPLKIVGKGSIGDGSEYGSVRLL